MSVGMSYCYLSCSVCSGHVSVVVAGQHWDRITGTLQCQEMHQEKSCLQRMSVLFS